MNKRTRRKFADEFEDSAVKLVTDQGDSGAEVARNLGVNAKNLLGRWKKESMYPDDEFLSPGSNVVMHAELKRLRKENKLLKMEREILKKAAAFFAKELE